MKLSRNVLAVAVLVGLLLSSAGGVLADSSGTPLRPPASTEGIRRLVRFEGEIISRPTTPVGTWVIDGRDVSVTEETEINEEHGPAVVGAHVLVVAKVLPGLDASVATSVLEALLIRVIARPVVTIRGEITELGDDFLVVNLLRIHYDASTEIMGELSVGALVKVRAIRLAVAAVAAAVPSVWPSLHALSIEVLPQTTIEFVGEIKAMGQPVWEIGDYQVTVDRRTRIVGRPAVGLQAKVRAVRLSSGELLALTIHVLNEPTTVEWRGIIESMPARRGFGPGAARPPVGEWVIGGRRVQVTAETEIVGEPRVGLPAMVTALQYPQRPLVAQRIEVLAATLN